MKLERKKAKELYYLVKAGDCRKKQNLPSKGKTRIHGGSGI